MKNYLACLDLSDILHHKLSFTITVIGMLLLFSWKVYGYAEIHYTFFRYSMINRWYPEIIVDTPWRLEPGKPLPIVFIIKDADRFPVSLKQIIVKYSIDDKKYSEKVLLARDQSQRVADHYWYKIALLELPEGYSGKLKVSSEIEVTKKGIKKLIASDNLPKLSHAPFKVFVSPHELPRFPGWYCGDSHYHSDMTQDQIEFGAPIEVAAAMGSSMGLNWLAVTDHSYDLDIAVGEYFKHDPKLARWWKVRSDADAINSMNNGFVVIPAEEISCGNCKGHNIHLLAYNTPHFIPGKGDGVKRGLNKRPDLTLRQCINRINNTGGFAYAAHPEEGNGYLGTLMLNRDHWRDLDYIQRGYVGLQFWNGSDGKEVRKSYEKWIRLLLEGRRLYILGGNDSHGDFNRCRKVKYPNTRLTEDHNNVFGKMRTYACCGDILSHENILDALKNGRTVVTNGPLVIFHAQEMGKIARVGEEIVAREFTLTISAKSSAEFGSIDRLDLYRGDFASKAEYLENTFVPKKVDPTGMNVCDYVLTYNTNHKSKGYFRIEATSSVGGKQYKCITNPIWFRSV